MKKISRKQRERDVKKGIQIRKSFKKRGTKHGNKSRKKTYTNDPLIRWINDKISSGVLDIFIDGKQNVTINLPDRLNFYDDYETTALYMAAIRKLSSNKAKTRKSLKLSSVNFDNLKYISTSAALVLTAELSKWDDAIRQNLTPNVCNWDPDILQKFKDLGFFRLFKNSPEKLCKGDISEKSNIRLVKYIKGKCGDNDKARTLKEEILEIVGETVSKWTFLHSGLTEAITNVSHHAYPENYSFSKKSKVWYLSGSFDSKTKILKVVFYDQGIGIPKSLPASKMWEKVLSFLSILPIAERKKDEVLLKAAVQVSRTSTGAKDRGKGLQDLLEFIRQRQDGYLSILSLKGLYKFIIENGAEKVKSERFENSIKGTLIIWSVTLND